MVLLESNIGDQLPVIPLFEMVGNVISVPAQLLGICVKSGIVGCVITTVMSVAVAQSPASGVKV